MNRGYLLYNGHKLPLVDTRLNKGKVIFTFSISLPGWVEWPATNRLPIYGEDDTLIMVHPAPVASYKTENGTYTISLPVAINELRWYE